MVCFVCVCLRETKSKMKGFLLTSGASLLISQMKFVWLGLSESSNAHRCFKITANPSPAGGSGFIKHQAQNSCLMSKKVQCVKDKGNGMTGQ